MSEGQNNAPVEARPNTQREGAASMGRRWAELTSCWYKRDLRMVVEAGLFEDLEVLGGELKADLRTYCLLVSQMPPTPECVVEKQSQPGGGGARL